MAKNELDSGEKRSVQLRRLLIPDWLWQFTYLRHLPRYLRSIPWEDCNRPKWKVALDLLYIFFILRTVPEHYGTYRLWEVPKKDWVLYCGSPYTPLTWGRIAKRYPFEYTILYNDKLAGAQLCKSLKVRQPITYGTVEPDQPFRERITSIFESSGQSKLLLKPVYGRSGMGIVLAEKKDSGIVVHARDREIPLSDFRLEFPIFVQELIRQDPRIAAIWNSSVNTFRIALTQTISGEIILLGAYLRCGIGKSIVDNMSAGGVAVGIETETGRLRKYGGDTPGRRHTQHPSSGFVFEGFQVPEWPAILEAARSILREIPFSKVPGLDMCLDENGKPVLIEINGLPDWLGVEQMNGPLLSNEKTRKAFAEYGLLTGPQRPAFRM